jgi:hypothetical protein
MGAGEPNMSKPSVIDTGTLTVATGTDGHLFLVGGAHAVLAYTTGEQPIPDKAVAHFVENITRRKQFAHERGIPYCHLVCPDKHNVISDHFPFPIKVRLGEHFQARCPVKFIYPVSELRQAAGSSAYFKTDTHWTYDGCVAIVKVLTSGLGIGEQEIQQGIERLSGCLQTIEKFSGDLGNKLEPRVFEVGRRAVDPTHTNFFSNRVAGSNGTITIAINEHAPRDRRLLIFGDSFVLQCLGMLSLFFSEILFIRSPYMHFEIVDAFKPSHMLSANAERYLTGTPSDKGAPLALLMASLEGKTMDPTPQYYEALDAALQPGSIRSRVFWSKFSPTSS